MFKNSTLKANIDIDVAKNGKNFLPPRVQNLGIQSSIVQNPSVRSPSAQASRVQVPRRPASKRPTSRHSESKHPGTKSLGIQSPIVQASRVQGRVPGLQSPHIQESRVQASRHSESKCSGIQSPSAGHCLYFWTSRSAGAIQPWKLLTVELSNCSDVSHNFFFVSKMWEFNAIFAN